MMDISLSSIDAVVLTIGIIITPKVELYNTFKERFSPLHTGMIVKVP